MEGFLISLGLVIAALLFTLLNRIKKLEARLSHLEHKSTLKSDTHAAELAAPAAPLKEESATPTFTPRPARKREAPPLTSLIIHQLQHYGLLWLGGIALALGGVFLALYAIDAGILSPAIRLLLGGVFGIGLVAGAEYLTRHRQRFNIHTPYIPAAIACGGIICCYAVIMVAFDAFALLSAATAFILLAILSLLSTWLTLRYGMLLAVVGVAGAYLVPLLIPAQSSSLLLLTAYLSLVTASATYISQRTSQPLLGIGALVAHALLSLGALLSADFVQMSAVLLNAAILLYLYGVAPITGWLIRRNENTTAWYPSRQALAAAVLTCCYMTTAMWLVDDKNEIYLLSAIFSGLLLLISVKVRQFVLLSPVALFMTGIAIILAAQSSAASLTLTSPLALFAQCAALVFSVFGIVMSRQHNTHAVFHSLYTLSAPILTLLLVTVTGPDNQSGEVITGLTVILAMYGLVAAVVLTRCSRTLSQIHVTLTLHSCLLVIAILQLSGSLLSVFLAWQVGLLVFQSLRLQINIPAWIYKVVAAVLILRLTTLLWGWSLLSPGGPTAYTPLITYSLVLVPLVFSCWYAPGQGVRRWFTGVLLHVLALMTTSLSVWWLTGDTFISDIDYKTATLLSCNWLLLAAVYRWRSIHATVPRVFNAFSAILVTLALMFHWGLSVGDNPFFARQLFSLDHPAVWLTVLWGLPGIALCWLAYAWRHTLAFRNIQLVSGSVFIVLWINALIRLAFHTKSLHLLQGFSQSELYTYSVIWLMLATALLFIAQRLNMMALKKAGFGVLLVVVCKVFVIDMSHLTGLWRAISFLGLGGSLVLLGWLFQRFNQPAPSLDTSP
ncbi:DUF2339 domain-containing protein [Salinimonas sp. HHU 13199]|uniref:DUF2339 domain-containing protein n=1 Tax=Salinimonas profundi TaxID=2729140 RepID=A0ABR8LRG4_9ALTE|nr:DUF2339 domain-containing protein [Salinimonas profundi]MBD3587022.1 DUF2339 domain-containing protein [Salinimonas profundi]